MTGQGMGRVVKAAGVSVSFINGYQDFSPPVGGTLVAIGNFDGVHLGHRALIEHALAQAHARDLTPVVMTFHPHPASVLSNAAPLPLTTTSRKVELLKAYFADINVIVQPFDIAFSQIEAEVFVSEILLRDLLARYVLVGKNFHFGRGRRGNDQLLGQLGQELGFIAEGFELSGDAAGNFSSSRVRTELLEGHLSNVMGLLGRPHSVAGRVVPGDGRGRTLGFPTANLENIEEGLPPPGVYSCVVDELPDDSQPVRLGAAVMSLGPRPTVSRGETVEVHLLDHSANLYGKRLRVYFIESVRGIVKFNSPVELQKQIHADIELARAQLARFMQLYSAMLV
jgi:riboflavin kinase/FMN adenylyltransferase